MVWCGYVCGVSVGVWCEGCGVGCGVCVWCEGCGCGVVWCVWCGWVEHPVKCLSHRLVVLCW